MQNIILYGMRGTGKSTVGRKVAEKLGYIFIDLDDVIEKSMGISIYNYVQEKGLEAFRDIEYLCLNRVLQSNGKKLISLGGGTIVFGRNREEIEKLNDKIKIFLETDINLIVKRITRDESKNNKRPSLTGKEVVQELEEVYKDREIIYKENADLIINNNGTIDKVVVQVIKEVNKHKICIPIVNFEKKYLIKIFDKLNSIKEIEYIELRIDFLKNIDDLEEIIKSCSKKIIVTNRIEGEGGNYKGSFKESLEIQKQALAYGADFIDLELGFITKDNIIGIDKDKLIISYHNFNYTSCLDELKEIIKKMKEYNPKIYKLAVMPKEEKDVNIIYDLAEYFKNDYIGENYIFISMGELGKGTRIDVAKKGGFLTFATFGAEVSASGQIDYLEVYNKLINN